MGPRHETLADAAIGETLSHEQEVDRYRQDYPLAITAYLNLGDYRLGTTRPGGHSNEWKDSVREELTQVLKDTTAEMPASSVHVRVRFSDSSTPSDLSVERGEVPQPGNDPDVKALRAAFQAYIEQITNLNK